MMPRVARRCTAGVSALLALACAGEQKDNSDDVALELRRAAIARPALSAEKTFNPRLLRRFVPARATIVDPGVELSDARVELGRMLYHEKRLSKSHELSCNSCHRLDRYGVDAEKTSIGHRGQRGTRNAPTVYHAAGNFEQFWDGRAGDVESQALGPILNPAEMAAPGPDHVIEVLASMPEYVEAFKQAFPDEKAPLSFENVGNAIGAFERKLTTRARWDEYLEGNRQALSQKEVDGLKAFTNLGCMACHTGELLGGSMYEKVGAMEPWPNQDDQGRYAVTQLDADRMMFKVPTLRNISETAPYFHDGVAGDLERAVTMMGRHQLGLELEQLEVEAIVAWLRSLKGTLPERYVALPTLPQSTNATPKPDRS